MKLNYVMALLRRQIRKHKPLVSASLGGLASLALFVVSLVVAVAVSKPNATGRTEGRTAKAVQGLLNKGTRPYVNDSFAKAQHIRGEVVDRAEKRINEHLAKIAESINCDGFAEAALSWEGSYQLTQSSSDQRSWMGRKFDVLVVSPSDIQSVLSTSLQIMQQELRQANEGLCMELRLDTKILPEPTKLQIDLEPFLIARRDAIDKATEASGFAPVETVGNFVVSALVGAVAESAARNAGSFDKEGKPTTTNRNTALAAGFGAGMASDMLTTELIGSKRKLTESLNATVTSSLHSMYSKGKYETVWSLPMFECVSREGKETDAILMKSLGLAPTKESSK